MAKIEKKIEKKDIKVEDTVDKVKEEVKEVEEVKVKTEEPKSKRLNRKNRQQGSVINIDRKRTVPVVSVSDFPIGYNCKLTNMYIKWANYGDEHYMSIEEVLNMNSDSEKYLRTPWLIVDDEEFMNVMGLSELYDLVFELEDLDKFFKQGVRTIKEKLNELSQGMRNDVLNRAVSMVYNGEINNLAVVSMLKREFHIDIDI